MGARQVRRCEDSSNSRADRVPRRWKAGARSVTLHRPGASSRTTGSWLTDQDDRSALPVTDCAADLGSLPPAAGLSETHLPSPSPSPSESLWPPRLVTRVSARMLEGRRGLRPVSPLPPLPLLPAASSRANAASAVGAADAGAGAACLSVPLPPLRGSSIAHVAAASVGGPTGDLPMFNQEDQFQTQLGAGVVMSEQCPAAGACCCCCCFRCCLCCLLIARPAVRGSTGGQE
jgi:hypothetical protein